MVDAVFTVLSGKAKSLGLDTGRTLPERSDEDGVEIERAEPLPALTRRQRWPDRDHASPRLARSNGECSIRVGLRASARDRLMRLDDGTLRWEMGGMLLLVKSVEDGRLRRCRQLTGLAGGV